MLAFVIPLKPAHNSQDWAFDSAMLRAALLSMTTQTSSLFQIMVIIHDLPIQPLEDPRITYHRIPMAYLPYEKIPDADSWLEKFPFYEKSGTEYLFDQGRKQMYGATLAKQYDCQYIMCVDADDLVSKNLVQFVLEHQAESEPGWYVDKGYFRLLDKNIFVKHPHNMNWRCGSTHIVHRNYIPDFDLNDLNIQNSSFFAHHPYLRKKIHDEYGKYLKPLPFYAIVYTITHLNWWISTKRQFEASLKHKLIYWLRKVYFPGTVYKKFYITSTAQQKP